MKQPKKQKTKDEYQAMYDHRQELIKASGGKEIHEATKKTAKKFKCDVVTVYAAVQFVRSNKKGATE